MISEKIAVIKIFQPEGSIEPEEPPLHPRGRAWSYIGIVMNTTTVKSPLAYFPVTSDDVGGSLGADVSRRVDYQRAEAATPRGRREGTDHSLALSLEQILKRMRRFDPSTADLVHALMTYVWLRLWRNSMIVRQRTYTIKKLKESLETEKRKLGAIMNIHELAKMERLLTAAAQVNKTISRDFTTNPRITREWQTPTLTLKGG